VFIRSMATRGSLGGLSRATRDAVRVLDAAGFDVVLVETVGAGQSEVDIVRTAQTTLVVEAPGLGDDVQAIKAGILEIADVLAVNKADHPGADNTLRALRAMLELGHPADKAALARHHGQLVPVEMPEGGANGASDWIPPVVKTIAVDETGIHELVAALEQHRAYLLERARLRDIERQHIEIELYDRLRAALMERLLRAVPDEAMAEVIQRVQARLLDPQAAVAALLALGDQDNAAV
jgi:LAO/AO transport system kinase